MVELTNAEVLCAALKDFQLQEDVAQESVAAYIACPSSEECAYDGVDNTCCIACKVKWLLSRWDG